MCDECGKEVQKPTVMILDGVFGGYCHTCVAKARRDASPQSAQYHRDRDREEHQRDMLQPWVNGKVNPEFVRQYPDQAKQQFTEEELKEV